MEYLRRQLARTWYPFFGGFGSRLTSIQEQAIPQILRGQNVIICAQTASGKTEAVMAPVAERLLKQEGRGLRALYITPTRALAYDLIERLKGPVEELGLKIAVKTAERQGLNPKVPPSILITTPEGFDSVLARVPYVLENLQALVLDELHLIDNTYRGDQLRILIKRLLRIKKTNPLNFYALSATLESPEEVATRYFTPFILVQVPGQRVIDWEVLSWDYANCETSVETLYSIFRKKGIKKILGFANSRDRVENLAQALRHPPYEGAVFVHHARLSHQERREVEEAMKQWPVAICVATSTLEVGIDIGDIDAIVLFDAPYDISSLLQRIGRGNRKSDRTIAFGIYQTTDEKTQFESLFQLASQGQLESTIYMPCLSVAIQQIFSYLYQRRNIQTTQQVIGDILSPFQIGIAQVEQILDNLEKQEWIKCSGKYVIPIDKLMDEAERGTIHSNIPDSSGYDVIGPSGNSIGSVYQLSPIFFLKGRAWKTVGVDYQNNQVYVTQTNIRGFSQENVLSGENLSDLGKYFYLLPEELHGCYR